MQTSLLINFIIICLPPDLTNADFSNTNFSNLKIKLIRKNQSLKNNIKRKGPKKQSGTVKEVLLAVIIPSVHTGYK